MSSQRLRVYSNWPIVDSKGNSKVAQAVIFGLGSMFNHSTQNQNIAWERDTDRLIITYRALRDIPAGEELCKPAGNFEILKYLLTELGISYGSHLTFEDTDRPPPLSTENELEQFNQIHLD